mmetsp:Transcript_98311/g.194795  ORF Transcript_98311/g.194795 Transcript_98311/m.194795 type:complete len:380 (-) Transcript_98311:349-1488(-)
MAENDGDAAAMPANVDGRLKREDIADVEDDRAAARADEEFDDLGFALPPEGDVLGDSNKNYARWFAPKAVRRRLRFEVCLQRFAGPFDWASVPKGRLKALLRKGLPAEHRATVWWSVLGCENRRQHDPDGYARHVSGLAVPRTAAEIERDLQRTFPNHRLFRMESGQAELRNVLQAFANHSPRVQYCQGLNFIAALLLLIMRDPERAFWALVCAVDNLGVEGYYTHGMMLLKADMSVLSAELQLRCPKVASMFRREKVELMSICSQWYITWFCICLPGPTLLRVWDTLFFEGFKVLFRIALGIFRRAEEEVLKCGTFETIMERAQSWPRNMVQHNELLKASFKGVRTFRRHNLNRARDEAFSRVEAEELLFRQARKQLI